MKDTYKKSQLIKNTRLNSIKNLAADGNLVGLERNLSFGFSQSEIDAALAIALAYSQVRAAKYLVGLGADITWRDYDGVYYAVHNNEIEGLRYSIAQGVDVNVKNGMILNTCVMTSTNTECNKMMKWIINEGADLKLLSNSMKDVAITYGNDELKKLLNLNS